MLLKIRVAQYDMNSPIFPSMDTSTSIRVMDEWQEVIPEDLYIPPSAFEILLEHFEGPLDFLIYLIQKNGFDLLQLDIAPIATQYLTYISAMKSMNIELTADYMVMAALLADLKSRLLLPKPKAINLEKDPKQQLIQKLETYLRIKDAAEKLDALNILERDTFPTNVTVNNTSKTYEGYDAESLKLALLCVFNRPEPITHKIEQEPVQLEERIAYVQYCLDTGKTFTFDTLLKPSQGKMGMVVTFMAILELTRQSKVNIISNGEETPLAIRGA